MTNTKWFTNWQKILGAVIPKGPMCRDCADEDGTCPGNDNLPCDPTDEVIERFNRLKEENKQLKEALNQLCMWVESCELTDSKEYKVAKKLLE